MIKTEGIPNTSEEGAEFGAYTGEAQARKPEPEVPGMELALLQQVPMTKSAG